MNFLFERSVRERTRSTAYAFITINIVFSPLSYHILSLENKTLIHIIAVIFITAFWLVTVVMAAWLYRISHHNAHWHIEVNDREIVWLTPQGYGECSFRFPLDEVEKIICETSDKPDFSECYFLVTHRHDRYNLNPASPGIDMDSFVTACKANGIKYEEETI